MRFCSKNWFQKEQLQSIIITMYTEFEATFAKVNNIDVRARLKKVGAKLIRKEHLQRRIVFKLPEGHEINGGWARVRDEGNKITMSLKIVDGDKIENQKEIQVIVDSFENAVDFLATTGFRKKAYQETKREVWQLGEVEVTIDEWPFLEPFVEIEGKSEADVKKVAESLEFDYSTAVFGAVDTLYSEKYGISKDRINNQTPEILFDGVNPFADSA